MVLTVEEFRKYVDTDETDDMLTLRLEAVEQMIQGYTQNNFRKYMQDGVIVYPPDIKMGVANLMKWELERREKVGLASESLSRHSVTFADQTGANTVMGYPLALMGFLAPYMRARFGQGVGV